MANITIAIDCMGGDFGPSVSIPAIKTVLSRLENSEPNNHVRSSVRLNSDRLHTRSPYIKDKINFQLFGNISDIKNHLSVYKLLNHPCLSLSASENDVLMTDKPALALKNKKLSSMRLALESVRDGRAHACVSAGNTGALMAISRFILKMLPGIDRPAIISALPTHHDGQVYLLDLGANVDCNENKLLQFAIMGNELSKSIDGVESPKVALLNVGEEEIKGSERLRQAAILLNDLDDLNYVGFVEANQIFSGDYHVIVTDGFTGNSVLKASEGLSQFLLAKIKQAFQRNWWTKLIGMLAKPIIVLFKEEVNPERFNGASLIGLRGIVIKSHGSANINATACAIEEAILQSKQKVPNKIRASLEKASQANS